jgi:hypothetical protein
MRPDDRADRIKTLRDLWSEMSQNHTDIQRLWKMSKTGLVLSAGIAAPPPIEPPESSFESSSSSSSSSASSSSSETSSSGSYSTSTLYDENPCAGCYEMPYTITAVLSGQYRHNGTHQLSWVAGSVSPRGGIWQTDCGTDNVSGLIQSWRMRWYCGFWELLEYQNNDCTGNLINYQWGYLLAPMVCSPLYANSGYCIVTE